MATDERRVVLKPKWFEDIENDPNLDFSTQEMAYIVYAASRYGFYQEKINIAEVFGKEFARLNIAMSNIYGQIDNIKNWDKSNGANVKYDAEAIKECRLKGMTAREICIELGYPLDKVKSLTSNKGWVEANKILKEEKIQKSTDSVQNRNEQIIQKKTENTDLSNTESTENTDLSQKDRNLFNF